MSDISLGLLESDQGLDWLLGTVARFRSALSHTDLFFLFCRWDKRISKLIVLLTTVNAAILGARHLLGKGTDQAGGVAEVTAASFGLPHRLWIVLVGVRGGSNTLPVVAAGDLVRLCQTLSVIELFVHLNHSEVQGSLYIICIAVDLYVMIDHVVLSDVCGLSDLLEEVIWSVKTLHVVEGKGV